MSHLHKNYKYQVRNYSTTFSITKQKYALMKAPSKDLPCCLLNPNTLAGRKVPPIWENRDNLVQIFNFKHSTRPALCNPLLDESN